MDELLVSRHGESVASAGHIANGDPARDRGLTERGRTQAEALGRSISADPIELCITSEFPRTRETARIALGTRPIPMQTLPDLSDIRVGHFEGRPRSEYEAWVHSHSLQAAPLEGESRATLALRTCEAFEAVLALPHRVVLVVTHEQLISDLLLAMEGRLPPTPEVDVPYATAYRWTPDLLRPGIHALRGWALAEQPRSG